MAKSAALILVLASVLTCGRCALPPPCEPSATVNVGFFWIVDGSEFRYYVSAADPRNWAQAVATCTSLCAELLSLDSVQEYEFITGALQIIPNRPTSLWTSANDLGQSGVFTWVNNGAHVETFYPSSAQTGQPDGDGHCVALQLRVNGVTYPMHVMNDRDCANNAAFICKSRLPAGVVHAHSHPHTVAHPPPPPHGTSHQEHPAKVKGCKPKEQLQFMMDNYFVAIADGIGHKYFVSDTRTNWYGAMDACQDLCAELTSFDSEGEYVFLRDLARIRLGAAAPFWTAGLRLANGTGSLGSKGGPFIWATTGRPLTQFYPSGTLEPNNVNGVEHCVGYEYGAMSDMRCGVNVYYICRTKL